MSIHRSHRALRRKTQRFATCLGTLTIILSLLAPVISVQAANAAQDLTTREEPTECEPGFVRDPDTGECVPEEPTVPPRLAQPTCGEGEELDETTGECVTVDDGIDDIQAEPTSQPEIGEPPQQLPSTVNINLFSCSPEADPMAGWEGLSGLCSYPVVPPVTITHGMQGGGETPQVVSHEASWVDLPPGSHYLYATLPDAYVATSAMCGTYIQGETVPETVMMDMAGGNTITHELLNGESLFCDWFVFQAPPPPGYVQVHNRLCPEDFDVDAAMIEDFQTECIEPGVGTSFSVFTGEVELASGTTDGTGTAQLGEVVAGDILVGQGVPEGYPISVVYCFADYAFQPLEHSYSEADRQPLAGAASVAWSLAPDDLLECYWYNVPSGDQGVAPMQEGGEDNTFTVTKYHCPLGVVENGNIGDYEEICLQEHDGVEFTLTHAGGSFPGTTEGGQVSWDEVALGDVQLQETIPPGFKDPVAYCSYSNHEEGILGLYEEVDATGGLIERSIINDGWETSCLLFNMRDESANSLTVRSLLCPDGFAGDEVQAAMQCTEPLDGVTFLLDAEEAVSGAWSPGTAVFPDVESGGYGHTEIVPDGIGEVLFDGCHLNGAPTPTLALGGAVPATNLNFGEGDHWECWWYHVPEVTYDVLIIKHECAPGTEFVPVNAIPIFDTIKDACPEEMDGVSFTIDHVDGAETLPTTGGEVLFEDVPAGMFSLTEEVPAGYGQPLWYCDFVPTGVPVVDPEFVVTPNGVLTDTLDAPTYGTYICYVFNFVDDDRSVIVWKWACPEGLEAESEDFQDWADTCVNHPPGIDFTVTDANGDVTKQVAGSEWWAPVAEGDVSITEHTPPGFNEPIVFCGLEAFSGDGAAFAEAMTMQPVMGSTVSRNLEYPFFTWTCHFFNVPKPQGEVIIHKYLCPDVPGGYDPTEMGADPTIDCAEQMDGVTFTLTPQLGGAAQPQVTGDLIPGGVYWDMLEPGHYTITEDVPPDIVTTFVWSCTGSNIPAVHPQPLNVGAEFEIQVAPGDQVVCEWYNGGEPEDASVTVYKYLCWTPEFVSDVDCEIYEFGATFDLINGADQSSYGVKVTDAFGKATWTPVDPGVHELVELDGEACHIELSQDDGNGNPMVDMGEETVIRVYNCSDDDSTPGGKIPDKYPNTGVPSNTVVTLMLQGTPAADDATAEYFPVRCLEEQATSASGTEECPRGAIPEHIAIEAIGVDHEFEIVEVVDGVMQAPSGPDVASWYKESGRLGEANNMLVAGHLNYWGVPEGIFFDLHTLDEGDVVEITGNDGLVYTYEVEWVRSESNLAPPSADVIAATDEPSLTLITCGGSWNAAISEYDQRTVVRAVLVDVTDTLASSD